MEISTQSDDSSHPLREILIEKSLDAVVGIDATSHIIDWNRQAESIFGWKKEEATGQLVSSLIIPPEFRQAHHAGIERFLGTGVGPILNRRIELEALHVSGRKFPIELTVAPIHSDGKILFYAFVRDISERRAMESALKDAVRERDEFISICSHELKTPITTMKLQFQMTNKMISEKDPKDFPFEAVTKRMSGGLAQLDRMAKIIEDMLDISRITAGKLKIEYSAVDMNELVGEVLAHFQEQLETLKLEATLNKSIIPAVVLGDKFRLEQVVTNLITNAIKYGQGKPFSLSVEVVEGQVRVTIMDRGVGIAEEDLAKIFSRYGRASTDSNIHGLGLGLYISEQIVQAHKGNIRVESEVGKGSKFIVSLPFLRQ